MIKLFHGKNSFLSYQKAHQEIEQIQQEYKKNGTDCECKILDASTKSCNEIINDIETPSLFQEHKIIFIKRLSDNRLKDDLRDFFQQSNERDLPEDILIWESEKIRSNSKYLKSFKQVYESPDLDKRTFMTWIKNELAHYPFKLTVKAQQLLAQRTNFDPERFLQELAKLNLARKETIDEKDIELFCPDTLEHTVWELIDSLNTRQNRKASMLMQSILRQGHDAFFVLLMITRNIRLIFLTKRFKEKGLSIGQIASKLKTPPFAISNIISIANKTSYAKIKVLYQKLYNIDYSGKTGQLDVSLALDILLSVI